MTKLILLCSSRNLGDVSNANAIIEKLNYSFKIDEKINIDISNNFTQSLEEFNSIKHKDLILVVGEGGINFLSLLNDRGLVDHEQTKILASLHQYDKKIENVRLDYLSIPEVVVDDEEKKRVLGKIPGVTLVSAVPTRNPSTSEIKISYDNWNIQDKPSLNQDYILVMLPGDAQDGQGVKRLFNKASCKSLFEDVKALWQRHDFRHSIIIQNSPRTGKYQEDGNGEFNPNEAIDKIDPISKYFLSLLRDEGINYKFYNFHDANSNVSEKNNSIFKQMLYIAMQPGRDNYFILPGESVSMLGQLPLYLNAEKIIVFKPSSMNEQHEKLIEYNFNHSYISYFDENAEIKIPDNPTKKEQDDVDHIVHDMVDIIEGDKTLIGEVTCEENSFPSNRITEE